MYDKELLFKYQDGRCMYFGHKLAIHSFHVEHKLPRERRGSNKITNKQLVYSL